MLIDISILRQKKIVKDKFIMQKYVNNSGLKLNWFSVMVLSFLINFFIYNGSEFIWVIPFKITVKWSEKNDPDLIKVFYEKV